jgi:hypothetical protein
MAFTESTPLKPVTDPRDEYFAAGYVAVCEQFPEQDFYVAILYHEWFMVENR